MTLFDTMAEKASESRGPIAPEASGGERAAPERVWTRTMDSPLGPLFAAATDRGVCLLEFGEGTARTVRQFAAVCAEPEAAEADDGTHPVLEQLERELGRYFAGMSGEFDVALAPVGTEFQQRVWAALRKIPCGQTRSYAQVAARIGQATATRAVANANGANRIAILIPCHRVIGSDGSLTGYGGGLERKDWLLRHEEELTSLFSPAQMAAMAH